VPKPKHGWHRHRDLGIYPNVGESEVKPSAATGVVEEALETILSTVDMQAVLERTGAFLKRHFGETRVSIHKIAPDDPGSVEIVFVYDPSSVHEGLGRRVPVSGSVCGEAIRRGCPVEVHGIDPRHPRFHEETFLGPLGYRFLVSFPLTFERETLGTLDIALRSSRGLQKRRWKNAEQLSRLIAIALHNSMLMEETRRLNRMLGKENVLLKTELTLAKGNTRYLVESPLMREVMEKVRLVAPTDMTVLIRGETGTGKEGLARLLHDLSARKDEHFAVVNLAAIPETLIESELFGHEKGSFTGASQRTIGLFETAAKGTLFLDEVGDAPVAVQVKLLRALQEREIQRLGSNERIPIDVRVVAATNRPLEAMVEDGTFRSDLYYRLNMFPLQVPPLRERRDAIRALTVYFVERFATTMHVKPPVVPEAAFLALEAHDWPGNVRELENTVARALILGQGKGLVFRDLASLPASQHAPRRGRRVVPFDEAVREILSEAVDAARGRIYGPAGAAALLRLRPTTLQGKLKRYGVEQARRR
jgi:formate hydrogenlyase transcriptional activator